jgi:nitrile hydratase
LGLPHVWYKSAPYRSRAVIDPRGGVLREFGLELAEDVEVRVGDTTPERRYLVLPERPEGTEGMSEEELGMLVTRDLMVGVAKGNGASPAGHNPNRRSNSRHIMWPSLGVAVRERTQESVGA